MPKLAEILRREINLVLKTCGLALALFLLISLPSVHVQGLGSYTDIGLETQFQDFWGEHHKRGRATVAADFDLDGRLDFYIGNPGDESFIFRNVSLGDGEMPIFQVAQVLVVGDFTWGAAAADYDNDGDYDLFISVGGNEGVGYDYFFRNLWMESGQTELSFEDVTDIAGVRGPVPPGENLPDQVASANAVWGDYNRDGYVDLFVNVNRDDRALGSEFFGRNILWENNGDGTFTDVTDAVGLGASLRPTRHSTFLDIDNDGDLDLYESNFEEDNVLWRNDLVETGIPTFQDVTSEMSLPGEDLRYPYQAFASASADFNNDGWQDIIVFHKRNTEEPPENPYADGHAMYLNMQGTGFRNVASQAGFNHDFESIRGVMGCQIGDLNGDGIPDIYVGNGDPAAGQTDQLYMSDGNLVDGIPRYINQTNLIDYPAPLHPSAPPDSYPPYPYRTHGTAFVDVDGDGILEIAVANGGTVQHSDSVREPNRLFKYTPDQPFNYLIIRPVGNGTTVSRDAIGTRFALTIRDAGGQSKTLWKTLFAGSAFSAQNGFEVYFGLGDADQIESLEVGVGDAGQIESLEVGVGDADLIESLEVFWPDGSTHLIRDGLSVNTHVVVEQTTAYPVNLLTKTHLFFLFFALCGVVFLVLVQVS